MMRKWKRGVAVCGLLLGLMAVGAMVLFMIAPADDAIAPDGVSAELQEKAPLCPLEVTQQVNDAGERVFNIGLPDMIKSYNGYYYEAHGERYLRDVARWQNKRQAAGLHFAEETDTATYCLDMDKWTLPRMTVYRSPSDSKVREVMCNYDDHSYSPQTFALYEEMCAYALRVFVPSLKAEDAQKWVSHINKVGDDNTFNSDKQYRKADTKPTDLFVHENVGVFSYVAIGAPLNFCIIPVDESVVQAYEDAGVRIHSLE